MILTDSHMHTAFSSDSEAPMEEMIKEAIQRGLTSICITDHYDIEFPPLFENKDFQLDTPSYIAEFYRLKDIYGKQIDLRIGVELGVMPDITDKLNNYMAAYQDVLDFVIGSTHLVNRMDPYLPQYYGGFKKEEDGIKRYFEENIKNLSAFHKMNSFGHCDYAVRYAPNKDLYYKPSDHTDLIDLFLKTIIEKGIALEVNSAGIRSGLKYPNPHIDILKRYGELGGELLTIGSDAHKTEHITCDFDKVEHIIKEAGFDYYTIYRRRKPEMIRL